MREKKMAENSKLKSGCSMTSVRTQRFHLNGKLLFDYKSVITLNQ